MTWDEIYDRAIDTAFGDPRLKAKDEARFNICQLALELGMPDLENEGIPEEAVKGVCDVLDIRFNEHGDIIYLKFPCWIEDMICNRRNEYNLKEDILNRIDKRKEYDPELNKELNDDDLKEIMYKYSELFDCNIDYNSTIDNAIDRFLGKY